MSETTAALHDLASTFGEPDDCVALRDGGIAWVWERDPAGDGIVIARASSAEAADVLDQIAEVDTKLTERGRIARQLVIAMGVDGERRFRERPDLLAVEIAVTSTPRWCRFVAFQDLDRIATSREACELFLCFLIENEIDLELVALDSVGEETVRFAKYLFSEAERLRAELRR